MDTLGHGQQRVEADRGRMAPVVAHDDTISCGAYSMSWAERVAWRVGARFITRVRVRMPKMSPYNVRPDKA